MSLVIHWFRRDLRLYDNPSLAAAADAGAGVLGVYVLSRWQRRHRWTGAPRQQYLLDALRALARKIEAGGGRLVIAAGDPVEELCRIARESGAGAIHFNRAIDWHGIRTDEALGRAAAAAGLSCRSYNDSVLHEPHEVLTREGTPYRVYTPYGKAWMALPKPAVRHRMPDFVAAAGVASLPVPGLDWWQLELPGGLSLPEAGEDAARRRMDAVVSAVLGQYAARRDIMGAHGTSRLSADLRHGLLSVRELYARAADGYAAAKSEGERRGHQVFLQELAWREFYVQILRHFPAVLDGSFNPSYAGMRWRHDDEALGRWQQGMTGFPIVDAGMRQLRATGWMHNRARMITAMFLTKDLHLDWREGEKFFLQWLVDGEIASNNGGWQWSAGTGADAAPYFRIQNPWSQTRRYDPEGTYIKTWVPELRDVPGARLCEPPPDGRPLAAGYPLPMVDHARERDVTLEMFQIQRSATKS